MTSRIPTFTVGDCYSSADVQLSLGVGNAGGVRLCLRPDGRVARLVIMTSAPGIGHAKENPYHDRIEGNVLVYTGAGREGDQSLAGANKRLPHQLESDCPIYGFLQLGSRRDAALGPKRWRFLGLLEYLSHYPELQLDARRQMRRVWLFEFRIHAEPPVVDVSQDSLLSISLLSVARERDRATAEDRTVAASDAGTPSDAAGDASEVEKVRARLLSMRPVDFEHLIKEVLQRTGFDRVVVTKYSQDGGIDVNAVAGTAMWPLRDLAVQIQAKRWLHTVGRKEVAELRGSLQPHARGAVVTTSHFSHAAIREAAEPGKNPIVLVDGFAFAALVRSIHLQLE